MNARKKTWTNSMFAELSHFENKSTPKSENFEANRSTDINDLDDVGDISNSTPIKNLPPELASVHNQNWIDLFVPRASEDLAVHSKKLQEIKNWFLHCKAVKHKQPAQICLITGPSGSGKTTAVRVLANENNICIQEWINPIDQEVIYNLGDQLYGQSFNSSQLDAFKNFLFKASRYRSLLESTIDGDKRLLLVEDIPNFLLRDPNALQEILEDYVNFAKSPLVFIVTDAKSRSLNISYNLFTDQLKQKFVINHITFNAVASTIMQRAMKRFCNLMRSSYNNIYKMPSSDIIESIVTSAQGDIRNALINLHFFSLKGAPNLLTKRLKVIDEAKTSKKRKLQSKLKTMGCDESLSIMHALGRVFNPKFNDDKRFLHSPEELAESFIMEPKRFIDLVQANYVQHFRDIDDVLIASNGLSLCDVIFNEYRDDSLTLTGLNVGIRSVMVANANPLTGWMPVKGQKRLDLNAAKIPAHASKVLPDQHNISLDLYALDYRTFVNIISPS